MTEIEIAEQRLARTRAARCQAARQRDAAPEKLLTDESYACWIELEQLKRGRQ